MFDLSYYVIDFVEDIRGAMSTTFDLSLPITDILSVTQPRRPVLGASTSIAY
jgi:hypothetical protein